MRYEWFDYSDDDAETVDGWMDEDARFDTGCDDGWDAYITAMYGEDYIRVGENFRCKVIFSEHQPIAAVACYLAEDGTLCVLEFVVRPDVRGKGHGRTILRELLCHADTILGWKLRAAQAVIFPNNKASVRAFEAAGFRFTHAHPDGDAWYYKYDIPNPDG